MATTYRKFGEQIVPPVLTGEWGEKLFGTFSTLVDALAEAMRLGVTTSWHRATSALPDDALAALSKQFHLPRYLSEARSTFLGRVKNTWSTWEQSGGPLVLVEQLATAGYPDAEVLYSWSPGLPGDINATQWEGDDWVTEFWIWIPEGSHTVTSDPIQYGDVGEDYGEGRVYGGLGGITRPEIEQLRRIVNKWKPGLWICRHILFDLGSGNYAKLAGFRGGGLGDY